jgi:hypothetical protein
MIIDQSTAVRIPFLMVDATDRFSAETGKAASITAQISKCGEAFATMTNNASIVETANGWYYIETTTTETNTPGALVFRATCADCAEWRDIHQVYDTWNVIAESLTDRSNMTLSAAEKVLIGDITVEGSLTIRKTLAAILSAVTLNSLNDQGAISFKNYAADRNRILGNVDALGQRSGVTFDFTDLT